MTEIMKIQLNVFKSSLYGSTSSSYSSPNTSFSTANNLSTQPSTPDNVECQYKWVGNGFAELNQADCVYYANKNQPINKCNTSTELYSSRKNPGYYEVPQVTSNDPTAFYFHDIYAGAEISTNFLPTEYEINNNNPNQMHSTSDSSFFQTQYSHIHNIDGFRNNSTFCNMPVGQVLPIDVNENDSVSMSAISDDNDPYGYQFTYDTESPQATHVWSYGHHQDNHTHAQQVQTTSRKMTKKFKQEYEQQQQQTKRKRKRILNRVQRAEATIREKRRMLKLNKAFEDLRRVLPLSEFSKEKLSRADTLKSAIEYIQRMSDLLLNY
jgi:hypothetical protein